jgi:hypothetical protein
MLAWIVRILLILAAPIAALMVSRDALNFGMVQTMVAMILVTAFVGVAAIWSRRDRGRITSGSPDFPGPAGPKFDAHQNNAFRKHS